MSEDTQGPRDIGEARQALAAMGQRPMQRVPVRAKAPELAGLYLQEMSNHQTDDWEEAWSQWRREQGREPGDMTGFRAMLVAHTLVNAAGARVIGPNDLDVLRALPNKVLKSVYLQSARLNGVLDEEELEKN